MPDPYANQLLDQQRPCKAKTVVRGHINCILHARAEQRGLELVQFPSRAVLKHEIHELILTTESEAAPGRTVNQISYLGYFEVDEGGVLWVGDQVYLDGKLIGALAGYDLTHFPNHMNIVLAISGPRYTGHEAGIQPGALIEFRFSEE